MKTKLIITAYRLLVVAVLISTLNGCTSATKQLTYVQDLHPSGEFIQGQPNANFVYRVHIKDNLFVKINSSDAETNKMYDPSETGAQPAPNYEGAAARTLQGNIVAVDGTITIPLLGKVNVEGKSLSECEELVAALAKKYLKEVTVKVRLLNYKVTVLGEVKVPGEYYNYNEYYTILDAISNAQGTTDFAKLDGILILRTAKSGTRTYNVDLKSKSMLGSEGFYLQPNDVVIVQPGKNKDVAQKIPIVVIAIGSFSALLLLLNYLK